MSVYCKNCKFYVAHTWGPGVKDKTYADECKEKSNCEYEANHIGKKIYRGLKLNPQDLNKQNDCSMYKRKWWKFRV